MKYVKPVCECGEELVLWRQDIYTIQTPINKNGLPSKTKIDKQFEGTEYLQRLSCPKCDKEYKDAYDNQKRVIRGQRING